MSLVQGISDGTTPSQIEAHPRLFQAVQSIPCILDSLGYPVFARIVPLNVVDELLGGTVRIAWRKLRGYVEYERERAGSQKNWEWFQWLAEQIDRHSQNTNESCPRAHDAYRDWRPWLKSLPRLRSANASLIRLSRICVGVQAANPNTNAGFRFA
jgi:hypothetical protein